MDIIKIIRAEIEKRLALQSLINGEFAEGSRDALNGLLSFLSTLESEKPVPNDLEEAAKHHSEQYRPHWPNQVRPAYDSFIAGAKWQAEQDQETIELAEDHAYLAGSVNEREKMMKDAVEVEVTETCGIPCLWLKMKDCKEGDKVRIIIINED